MTELRMFLDHSNPNGRMGHHAPVQALLPDGQVWSFSLQAHFCNVAHPVGEHRNRLPELLRTWFGPDVGKPGTQYRVPFERGKEGWRVTPLQLGGDVRASAQERIREGS